jgi:alpha-glucosidase (family GH31 glycosyl hydrolase)
VTWHPGLAETGNLEGTTRTLDGALGAKVREPLGEGLVSRDGWALVDDSHRPLFDSDNFTFAAVEKSEWPWVMERPVGDRQDLYIFGCGHDYKAALHDYVRVAGRIPLPCALPWAHGGHATGPTAIRNWKHWSTTSMRMTFRLTCWSSIWAGAQLRARHETDESGHELGCSGYTWNPLLFPDPATFLHTIHEDGLKVTLNLHPASSTGKSGRQLLVA